MNGREWLTVQPTATHFAAHLRTSRQVHHWLLRRYRATYLAPRYRACLTGDGCASRYVYGFTRSGAILRGTMRAYWHGMVLYRVEPYDLFKQGSR